MSTTPNSTQKSLLVIFSVLITVTSITFIISILARGYQPEFNQGSLRLKATGIIAATSKPKSASVYVDNVLTTVTDGTINLTPDTYLIRIEKDGYFPWEKQFTVEKEKVYQTETELFLSQPKTLPFIETGVSSFTANHTKNRFAFYLSTPSANLQPGIYLVDTSYSPFQINKTTPKPIILDSLSHRWSNHQLSFSPDSKQLLASTLDNKKHYLINLEITNNSKYSDITASIDDLKDQWQQQLIEISSTKISQTPIATTSSNISYSSDESKILYLSPDQNYYVFDLKKQQNHFIGSKQTTLNPFWLYQSNNLVYQTTPKNLLISDYDGQNQQLIITKNDSNLISHPSSDANKLYLFETNSQSSSIFEYQIR